MELIALSEFIAIFLLLAETINYLDSPEIVPPACGRIRDAQLYLRRQGQGAGNVTERHDYFDDAA